MQQVSIIINQIIMLSLLGVTGFIAGKTGYLPENSGVILSRVVIKLTAPLLIFTTMANYNFEGENIGSLISVYGYGVLFLLLAFLIGKFMADRLRLQGATGSVYKMQSMFGNVIFMAYPLLASLFGERGIIYAVFFNLANDTVLWTLGVYLVNKHNNSSPKDNLKHLINGNTLAFVLGVLSIITNLQYYVAKYPSVQKVYSLVYNTFNPLGKTTIYLSMLFIGLILSQVKMNSFSDVLKRYPIFILSFFKLIFVPAAALGILTLLGRYIYIDNFARVIVILQLSMPCATIVPALAAQYDSDYKFATEAVFFTTLFSVVTMPAMVYILDIAGLL
ncbi:MAG: AEC family transporter [Clostridia bacterium]|nr:AEC family transporter [Clostridia bacterium]